MHETSFPPPNAHFPSTASRGCPVTLASTGSTILFFSAGATTLDNPSGICSVFHWRHQQPCKNSQVMSQASVS